MAFLVSRDPLTPQRKLQARIAPGTRVLRAADVDAWTQAEGLVAAARAQAEAIVGAAQAAHDEECRRGYAEGLAEAQMVQAEKMMETASRTIEYFSQVETDMVALVMGAVRKIMEDYDDADRVVTVVRNALAVVRNQKQMTLRLHPQQVETVRSRINYLLSAFPGVGYLDIVADARLGLHACVVESEIGLVEASIEGQLAALERAFQKVLGSRI
ncbi:HrpE/YscL family type III secretion apparatus protein [Comamonas endophytica]|uniref:Type 3 secretion system stator protein n=1 Tax=Comamonas endophytica TaxID=2949090 RepID=A0ABY6GCL8_9BURK|nr:MULTISPECIES: HrpE/YscL family type III secretion apparatus protein [unclassified Acidovorax]MCD2512839.1 HrpE/YscL family type III secretion apparatus protein [Acidovorax sp. D4N7]UYG52813.1 HrpE/YscL family type III secretion apparatus protein [Acidovorax sp. 5MLIR]